MLRMEIALFLILSFVAYIYFSARRERTPCTAPSPCCWSLCWCI